MLRQNKIDNVRDFLLLETVFIRDLITPSRNITCAVIINFKFMLSFIGKKMLKFIFSLFEHMKEI